ncbi:MAG: hypothetical protein QXQ91_02655 [Nanopusillaceae archaeon]
MRVVFLNALPLNAFADVSAEWEFRVKFHTLDTLLERISEIRETWRRAGHEKMECVSYIRHAGTKKALSALLNGCVENSAYKYTPGDYIFIVTLRQPARGQEVEVSVEDLLLAELKILWRA